MNSEQFATHQSFNAIVNEGFTFDESAALWLLSDALPAPTDTPKADDLI